MDVLAEGIEGPGQMRILREMRCAFLQGWLFGGPMDLDQLTRQLEAFDPSVLDSVAGSDLDRGVHTVGRPG
jgi:EAL domain-containing protein (putative c-di-GMP-specific phosphodiesterase class I)